MENPKNLPQSANLWATVSLKERATKASSSPPTYLGKTQYLVPKSALLVSIAVSICLFITTTHSVASSPSQLIRNQSTPPTTDSPTTNPPTTDSPTTDSPTTDSPTTDSPTTDSPTTNHRTTDPLTEAAIRKWSKYFEHSVLTEEERLAELRWFAEVTAPFRGRKVRSVAEDIKTHFWESEVLANAFEEITGIQVTHEVLGEGTVVERLVEQQRTGRVLYDIYVNDADLIGTHLRSQGVVNLTDYMNGAGRRFTNPTLDLDDFLNLEFGQDYDGDQLQLPDQQFANLYWFRYDWFTEPTLQAAFKADYGYDLGVPLNWAAYEDIAEFFTGQKINGQTVYGHLDYGKKSPSLGWRFTDAWLSIAGVGDVGLPNGVPVDEWGIRVENRTPIGASVERGGAANGPAAVYALSKYIEWLETYAPPEAIDWRWVDAGPKAARGDVAQRIFQYVTWLSDDAFHQAGSAVVDESGKPLWRVAPTPHGRYWDPGMKVGYQDAGSWTIPRNVRGQRRAMAWLWAQFAVSKTVSLEKFLVGGTPVRTSTVFADYVTEHQDEWGGLIEFYRSESRKEWTDTGHNIPDYPTLSALWWPNIARAIDGDVTPQQAMDAIAQSMDLALGQMRMTQYSPKVNQNRGAAFWLSQPGSPKPVRPRPQPQTIGYDELLQQWVTQGQAEAEQLETVQLEDVDALRDGPSHAGDQP